MKRRFSLRTLLAVATLAALFCYWRSRPAVNAHRFAVAMEDKQFDAAIALIANPQGDKKDSAAFLKSLRAGSFAYEPQTICQWLLGACPGTLTLEMKVDDLEPYRTSTGATPAPPSDAGTFSVLRSIRSQLFGYCSLTMNCTATARGIVVSNQGGQIVTELPLLR